MIHGGSWNIYTKECVELSLKIFESEEFKKFEEAEREVMNSEPYKEYIKHLGPLISYYNSPINGASRTVNPVLIRTTYECYRKQGKQQ